MKAAFQRGARRVLVRGTDTPTLSQEHLEAALKALEGHELVFSPDRDGGYGVVGFASFHPGLLDLPMSTETVLDETLSRAQAWGLAAARGALNARMGVARRHNDAAGRGGAKGEGGGRQPIRVWRWWLLLWQHGRASTSCSIAIRIRIRISISINTGIGIYANVKC